MHLHGRFKTDAVLKQMPVGCCAKFPLSCFQCSNCMQVHHNVVRRQAEQNVSNVLQLKVLDTCARALSFLLVTA